MSRNTFSKFFHEHRWCRVSQQKGQLKIRKDPCEKHMLKFIVKFIQNIIQISCLELIIQSLICTDIYKNLGAHRKFPFSVFEMISNICNQSQVSFLGTTIFHLKSMTPTHQSKYRMVSALLTGNWGTTQESQHLICFGSSMTAGYHLVCSGQKTGWWSTAVFKGRPNWELNRMKLLQVKAQLSKHIVKLCQA